ncbi:MAG: response regulator, partial [Desulfobacterales bacterium]
MPCDPQEIQVLLVEDTTDMRKIEIKTLQTLGLGGILEALDGDGTMGLRGDGRKVDLMISDWNMPNKDGDELPCWVRDNADTRHIPFLMATGR